MGKKAFPKLSKGQQFAVLYRDTQRLRHLVEKDLNATVSDEEWLRALPTIVGDAAKRIRVRRQPSLQQRFEELAANSRY